MMSWSHPQASRQLSKPRRMSSICLVDRTRFEGSAAASFSVLVKPNLWAVKPLGWAVMLCAHSLHEALSSAFFGAAWLYTRTLSRNLPPSSVVTGTPSILPARSHKAISMPLTARIRPCAEPSVRLPAKLGILSPMKVYKVSMDSGSLPISQGLNASTCSFTPTPGLP